MTSFKKLSLKPKADVNPVVNTAIITRKVPAVHSPAADQRVKSGYSPDNIERASPDKPPTPAKRLTKPTKPTKIKQPQPTPEELAANRAKTEAHTVSVLDEIMARWPLLFPQTGADLQYPLAIRIRHAIAKIFVDEGITLYKTPLTRAIGLYMTTHFKAYQTLLSKGGPRYTLEMQPDGEVTPDQIETALKRLFDLQPLTEVDL